MCRAGSNITTSGTGPREGQKLTWWPTEDWWLLSELELLLSLPLCEPFWPELFESQLDLVDVAIGARADGRQLPSPSCDSCTNPSPLLAELGRVGPVDQIGLNGVDLPTRA